jgi:crcB protein
MLLKQILLVGAGGAVGSIFRFLASTLIVRSEPFPFPVATFTVNMLGCFCIGLFSNLIPSSNLRFLLITGFCGGFTTFSTFSIEVLTLIDDNQTLLALVYIVLSCIIGVLAVWLGMHITK